MKFPALALAALNLLGAGAAFNLAGGPSGAAAKAPALPQQSSPATPNASLVLGKKVFVERCAKCHGVAGAEPLAGGPPLNERKLTDEQLTKNVRGRLKGSPEEEQRAVAAYIRSFQKKS